MAIMIEWIKGTVPLQTVRRVSQRRHMHMHSALVEHDLIESSLCSRYDLCAAHQGSQWLCVIGRTVVRKMQ